MTQRKIIHRKLKKEIEPSRNTCQNAIEDAKAQAHQKPQFYIAKIQASMRLFAVQKTWNLTWRACRRRRKSAKNSKEVGNGNKKRVEGGRVCRRRRLEVQLGACRRAVGIASDVINIKPGGLKRAFVYGLLFFEVGDVMFVHEPHPNADSQSGVFCCCTPQLLK